MVHLFLAIFSKLVTKLKKSKLLKNEKTPPVIWPRIKCAKISAKSHHFWSILAPDRHTYKHRHCQIFSSIEVENKKKRSPLVHFYPYIIILNLCLISISPQFLLLLIKKQKKKRKKKENLEINMILVKWYFIRRRLNILRMRYISLYGFDKHQRNRSHLFFFLFNRLVTLLVD